MRELIQDAEQLLANADDQLREIRGTIDDLGEGSVVLVEVLD